MNWCAFTFGRKGAPNLLLTRSFSSSEHELVRKLTRSSIQSGLFEMISYDAPYEIDERLWPSWFQNAGVYNGTVLDQTPEQLDWIVQFSPILTCLDLWNPNPGGVPCFSVDDACSVSIVVPHDLEVQVSQMLGFAELDELERWERREAKRRWW